MRKLNKIYFRIMENRKINISQTYSTFWYKMKIMSQIKEKLKIK